MTPHWNEWNHEAHIQEDGNLVGMHSEDHVNGHRGKYEIRKGGVPLRTTCTERYFRDS